MKKTVLDVGNCSIDHAMIEQLIRENFQASVLRASSQNDALDMLRRHRVHLVLVNRRLHGDYSEGLDLIRRMKADRQLAQTPVMLVSDLPTYQESAVAAGAEPGFGKSELRSSDMAQKLRPYLA